MSAFTRLFIAAVFLLTCTAHADARGGSSHSHSSSHSYSSGSRGYGYTNPSGHSVRGYTKKDGTYVAPHHATNPNGTKNDNYSTKGNTNTWTGKAGTKRGD
jgi:hypothetical protein